MEYILPQSHKELLQRILEELVMQRDLQATFTEAPVVLDVPPKLDAFGHPLV